MEEINNYTWIEMLPSGWKELARKMIQECEAVDPTYYICDLKEKWGRLSIIANCNMNYLREIDEIENRYESLSARTCCVCGQPAVKYSTGWILPWCDTCGKDEEKYYKRFDMRH